MELNLNSLKTKLDNVSYPKYDVEKVRQQTIKNPTWLHFGAGNIFRGYIARLADDMLNEGLTNTGVIAAETFDYEIISNIYNKHDSLTLLATLSATKPASYRIVSSICEGVMGCDYSRLKEIFTNPSLQMISFTITEKGYQLKNIDGEYQNIVLEDFKNGPHKKLNHAVSIVTSLLYERFKANKLKLAVVSMDNCSHNGEKLFNAVIDVAKNWQNNGLVEEDFVNYLLDENMVSFPWSMIDKITPRPDSSVEKNIEALGFTNMAPITTSKRTYIAPFVNAEVSEYLVIEDKFPNGRPPLDKVGVYLTSKETVNQMETMKVTTCLNPLHTALAVYGCLLNCDTIANEMTNPYLVKLVKGIGSEGMKVVVDPKIINPNDFLEEVIEERLPNKAIPDTPWRIATDTSQKVSVRYGETIKAYIKNGYDLNSLKYIPLAIAGWLRYLVGVNDKLQPMELSADPMLKQLKEELKDVKISKKYNHELINILKNAQIFGLDLTLTPLKDKIEMYFESLIAGEDAVINTLKKYIG